MLMVVLMVVRVERRGDRWETGGRRQVANSRRIYWLLAMAEIFTAAGVGT